LTTDFVDSAASQLEDIGYRATSPRRAVLEAIAETAPEPFTAEELASAVPQVGRATVFRTIRLLQELDVVCRVPLEDGSVRYQLSRSEHHHHLICSSCGTVSEFSEGDLDALIQAQADRRGFTLDGHSIELYGRCSACAGKSS
jgi:Fur family ferric uptake transcriptional regulator